MILEKSLIRDESFGHGQLSTFMVPHQFCFIAIRYGILPQPIHQDEYCRACPLTVPEHDLKIQKVALLS